MEVPSKTDVKRIVEQMTKERFKRLEIEAMGFRRAIQRLNEEITCLKSFKYKEGKNRI